MGEVTEEEPEEMEALLVQTAASMSSDGQRLTLKGVSPSTLYSDRPRGAAQQVKAA